MSGNLKSYSQKQEDLFILDYFKGYKGTLLDIGANDGITFSNSRLLIEQGWVAHLVEPGSVFSQLSNLYAGNTKVECHNFGIGERNEEVSFWESGAHVPGGTDQGLVSTVFPSETNRWQAAGVKFEEKKIRLITFEKFIVTLPFDFISIDAEGMDWLILKQIDLQDRGCRCLCLEWNGDSTLRALFTEYCHNAGLLNLALVNNENLIFVK